MIYFNHAGTSWPKPASVQAAARHALEADPSSWPTSFDEAHRAVSSAFGIADPARLLFTPGCTAALHVGITDLPWQAGDRIVTSAWEHHALLRPAQALTARGVEHVIVPPAGEALVDLDALEASLRRGVRLVALCAACNVTGALLPIDDIVRLARSHGAQVLVDAAQVAGWLTLDVETIGADRFAFAGHKGPQAPWGIGGLYVADGAMPDYCDTGSVDRAALAGLVAGFEWLAERPQRLDVARAQIERVAETVEALGAALHGPRPPEARVPTLAFTLPSLGSREVAARLRARDVLVSGGLQCARLAHETLGTAVDGVVRVSVGPATTDDEVDALCAALRAIA